MKKLTTIFIIVMTLVGCASGPKYAEVASQIPELEEGKGRIYFYRKSAAGAAVQPKVKINGEVVGKAQPKGFFYVDVEPGNYEITASTEAKRMLSMNMQADEVKYVRLEIKMGLFVGHIKPVLVDKAEGETELLKTSYIGE